MQNQWMWRNFSMEMPADWELLQFARNPEQGRCAFADRYQFRLEFSWRTANRAPDVGQVMNEYEKAFREQRTLRESVQSLGVAGWKGFRAPLADGTLSSRFGRYFDSPRLLTEAVLLWPQPLFDVALEETLLSSIMYLPPADNGTQRWKAFGMDLLADAAYGCEEVNVRPAYARFRFADTHTEGVGQLFERFGMVNEWLHESLEEWLNTRLPPGLLERTVRIVDREGHRRYRIEGKITPKTAFSRLRKPNTFRLEAWICPNDNRLYLIACISPPAAGGAKAKKDPAGGVMACCWSKGWQDL
jgi:hypothetical protein